MLLLCAGSEIPTWLKISNPKMILNMCTMLSEVNDQKFLPGFKILNQKLQANQSTLVRNFLKKSDQLRNSNTA